MNAITRTRCVLAGTLVLAAAAFGCDPTEPGPKKTEAARPEPPPVAGKRVPIGQSGNVLLEILPGDKRRVLVKSTVCLRQGQLEQLLCRKRTKEHEAILAADVADVKDIH